MAANVILVKHRDEERICAVDFSADLATGVTLQSLDSLTILDRLGVDVSSTIVSGTPSVTSPQVRFLAKIKAAADDQLPGDYWIKCRAVDSNGEKPVAIDTKGRLPILRIVGD